MMPAEDDRLVFLENPAWLARHLYYHIGLTAGLSLIEGGSAPTFLHHEIENLHTEQLREHQHQFEKGLSRAGIRQLIHARPSVMFLLLPSTSTGLTVQKILHLLPPTFSHEGSNDRRAKQAMYSKFVKYIRKVAAGRRPPINLAKVLMFAT
ncbi:PREDICTED: uncharacterized protein LOC106820456 isoform X2 [Priapulus caudatus]|nr:PREDICTED: uncharacterized protein LOC106820456 isoform X2 [Priapulus caudatus]